MLGYFILAHYRPEAVVELLEAIYSDEDAYLICLNGTVDPKFLHSLFWLQRFDNIRISINRGIDWAAPSMLEATLEGMRTLFRGVSKPPLFREPFG